MLLLDAEIDAFRERDRHAFYDADVIYRRCRAAT